MSKRRKTSKAMWINPHSNIRSRPVEWDRRQTDIDKCPLPWAGGHRVKTG